MKMEKCMHYAILLARAHAKKLMVREVINMCRKIHKNSPIF